MNPMSIVLILWLLLTTVVAFLAVQMLEDEKQRNKNLASANLCLRRQLNQELRNRANIENVD